MPHLDGTAAARQLRERGYAGELVFVTAYDQFAVAAFDARAIDYLVKPLDAERLGETVTRLRSRLGVTAFAAATRSMLPVTIGTTTTTAGNTACVAETSAGALPWLRVTRGTQTRLVGLDDVAGLRAVPGNTQLVTRDGEHLAELALKALQPQVDPRCFMQVHRAAIANLRFVEHIEREPSGRCVVALRSGQRAMLAPSPRATSIARRVRVPVSYTGTSGSCFFAWSFRRKCGPDRSPDQSR